MEKSNRCGMNFPKYWARGQSGNFLAWRWSSLSLADAQALAGEAARQLAERFASGNFADAHQGMYYPNRPFREQVLQEFKDASGAISAVVTRNSYGCLVLNTARVMFVDIDLPEPKPAGGFLQSLFGKPKPVAPTNVPEAELAKIESWTRSHPEWGWRVYRTRAGLRLLATQGLVEAGSSSSDNVLLELGSDPLYQKLCKSQKCFRARLTPKPWRCGIQAKPERWPWLDAKAETKFQKWEKLYQSYAFNWATCQLIRQIGNPTVHTEIQLIIKLHDDATRVASSLPLA
jgi:hypothetical protein